MSDKTTKDVLALRKTAAKGVLLFAASVTCVYMMGEEVSTIVSGAGEIVIFTSAGSLQHRPVQILRLLLLLLPPPAGRRHERHERDD
eukprot:410234-Heterocapsa_arctica.AAC.1